MHGMSWVHEIFALILHAWNDLSLWDFCINLTCMEWFEYMKLNCSSREQYMYINLKRLYMQMPKTKYISQRQRQRQSSKILQKKVLFSNTKKCFLVKLMSSKDTNTCSRKKKCHDAQNHFKSLDKVKDEKNHQKHE